MTTPRTTSLLAATGVLLWKFATQDVVHASPAVAGGIVYVGSYDSRLYALDADTGQIRWVFEAGQDPVTHNQVGFQSSPAVADGTVYVGCRDAHVYALDALTGRKKWDYPTSKSWVNGTPAVRDGLVYVGTSDSSRFMALDARTGRLRFNFDVAAEDFDRAASLAELEWPDWHWAAQSIIAWLDWVNALPKELVRVRPVLSVAYAQALLNAGKLDAAEARLLDAERWLETISDRPRDPSTGMVVVDDAQFLSLPVSLATTRAYHAQAIGDWPGTVIYTQRALDLLPEEGHSVRGSVTMLLGLAQWANGDLEAAHRTFSDGLAPSAWAGRGSELSA